MRRVRPLTAACLLALAVGGEVSGGEVSGGEVSGGEVSGGEVSGGAATAGPPVLGDWLVESGEAVVRLAPCPDTPDTLCGTLYPLAGGPHARAHCGHPLIVGLRPQADEPPGSAWSQGTLTDPRNGRRYAAALRLTAEGDLLMRGYVLHPALGQSQIWTRFQGGDEALCSLEAPG